MTTPNRRILVVDDNDAIHDDFRKVLAPSLTDDSDFEQAAAALFGAPAASAAEAEQPKMTFEIDSALQGQEGLQKVEAARQAGRPYAVAFVDVRMPPGWDGVETVRRLWQVDPDVQIVFCTAYSDRSWEDVAALLDRPDQYLILKKPFDTVEVRQLAIALSEKWRLTLDARRQLDRLENEVARRTHEVIATRDMMVFALARLAESRDTDTGRHLERMRAYAQMLAEQLQREGPYSHLIDETFLADLYRSSPLHDIGKVGIPDAVLLKPGKLTPAEFEMMKHHARIGAETLETVMAESGCGGFLEMAAEIARYHHERFDGTGYPHGLAGESIPLAARIVALADVYDALTSVRVYKPAFPADVARQMIEEQTGKHFDPAVVLAFQACFEQFRKMHEAPAIISRIVETKNVPQAV